MAGSQLLPWTLIVLKWESYLTFSEKMLRMGKVRLWVISLTMSRSAQTKREAGIVYYDRTNSWKKGASRVKSTEWGPFIQALWEAEVGRCL